jgi:hypothetical protein
MAGKVKRNRQKKKLVECIVKKRKEKTRGGTEEAGEDRKGKRRGRRR